MVVGVGEGVVVVDLVGDLVDVGVLEALAPTDSVGVGVGVEVSLPELEWVDVEDPVAVPVRVPPTPGVLDTRGEGVPRKVGTGVVVESKRGVGVPQLVERGVWEGRGEGVEKSVPGVEGVIGALCVGTKGDTEPRAVTDKGKVPKGEGDTAWEIEGMSTVPVGDFEVRVDTEELGELDGRRDEREEGETEPLTPPDPVVAGEELPLSVAPRDLGGVGVRLGIPVEALDAEGVAGRVGKGEPLGVAVENREVIGVEVEEEEPLETCEGKGDGLGAPLPLPPPSLPVGVALAWGVRVCTREGGGERVASEEPREDTLGAKEVVGMREGESKADESGEFVPWT